MKKIFLLIIVLIATLLSSVPTQASLLDNSYTLVSPEGISSGTAYNVLRDAEGFIWVSTRNGIDRYDGNKFRHYRLNGNVSRGLHDGMMIYLHQDSEGQLWAFSERSVIYRYNDQKDMFEEALLFPVEDNVGSVQCMYSYEDELLFGSLGLMSYQKGPDVKRIVNLVPDRMVRCIAPYRSGCLAIGTNKGLVLYDPESHRSTSIYDRFFVDVKTLYYDEEEQTFIVGTNGQGLYVVSERDNGRSTLISDEHLIVLKIHPVSKDEYLICTDGNGLLLAHRVDGRFQLTLLASDDPSSIYPIHSSCVRDVLLDGDNIWLCMHYGGMVRMQPSSSIVELKNPNVSAPSDSYSFGGSFDARGNIWLAFNQAIGCYDRQGHCQQLYLDHEARFLTVAAVADGTVWCGGFNTGLYHFDPVTGQREYFSSIHGSQANDCVYAIHQDPQGGVWVGGQNFGLTCIRQPGPRRIGDDPFATLAFDHTDVGNVCGIAQLTDSMLAVATTDGLYLINTFNRRSEHLFQVKDDEPWQETNYFCSVAVSSRHELWLATDGAGLLYYDVKKRTYESFGYDDGLPSLELRGVALLNDSTLCVTTEKDGAFMFNCRQHRFMQRLSTQDQTHGNQFQPNGICSSRDGHVLICGDKSAYLLSADDLTSDRLEAEIRLDGHPIIDGVITLPDGNHDLTLSVTTTDIYHQSQYQLYYHVSGLDDTWRWIDESRHLVMPHMPAGDYVLEVVAVSSSDNVIRKSVRLHVEASLFQPLTIALGVIILLLALTLVALHYFVDQKKADA